jgi:uncharacterized protein YqgC (DUF456 family)
MKAAMIALIILGFLLSVVGLVGSILPVLPGPPLSFAALIILSIARGWEPFGPAFLVVMGSLTAVVTILDYAAPALGAKRYGASKLAVWGAVIGMVVGILVFPPWGMVLGAFLGALVGEGITQRNCGRMWRAGWGVFVGTLIGTGVKLALSGIMLFFYLIKMF